jgi:hypothetical protein
VTLAVDGVQAASARESSGRDLEDASPSKTVWNEAAPQHERLELSCWMRRECQCEIRGGLGGRRPRERVTKFGIGPGVSEQKDETITEIDTGAKISAHESGQR